MNTKKIFVTKAILFVGLLSLTSWIDIHSLSVADINDINPEALAQLSAISENSIAQATPDDGLDALMTIKNISSGNAEVDRHLVDIATALDDLKRTKQLEPITVSIEKINDQLHILQRAIQDTSSQAYQVFTGLRHAFWVIILAHAQDLEDTVVAMLQQSNNQSDAVQEVINRARAAILPLIAIGEQIVQLPFEEQVIINKAQELDQALSNHSLAVSGEKK